LALPTAAIFHGLFSLLRRRFYLSPDSIQTNDVSIDLEGSLLFSMSENLRRDGQVAADA